MWIIALIILVLILLGLHHLDCKLDDFIEEFKEINTHSTNVSGTGIDQE